MLIVRTSDCFWTATKCFFHWIMAIAFCRFINNINTRLNLPMNFTNTFNWKYSSLHFQPIEEKFCDSEDDEGEVEDKLGQLQPSLHHQLAPHAPLVNPLWRSTTPTGEFTRMPSPPNWLHWSDWFYTKRNVKNT